MSAVAIVQKKAETGRRAGFKSKKPALELARSYALPIGRDLARLVLNSVCSELGLFPHELTSEDLEKTDVGKRIKGDNPGKAMRINLKQLIEFAIGSIRKEGALEAVENAITIDRQKAEEVLGVFIAEGVNPYWHEGFFWECTAGGLAREDVKGEIEKRQKQFRKKLKLKMLRGDELNGAAIDAARFGVEEAWDVLAENNRKLIFYVMNRLGVIGEDQEGLFSAGIEGMMRAAQTYSNPDVPFTNWAFHWIRNNIQVVWTLFRNRIGLTSEAQRIIKKGRAPLATTEERERSKKLIRMAKVLSLDALLGDSDDCTLYDRVENEGEEVRNAENMGLRDLLLGAMGELDEKKRVTLMLVFGLADGIGYQQKQVAQVYGITNEAIRQHQEKALKRLRKRFEERGLRAGELL